MNDKKFQYLLDAIEFLHQENIAIMTAIAYLGMDCEHARTFLETSTEQWKKNFDEFRKICEKSV